MYDNGFTFTQVSIDAVLLGSKEYYLEVLKPEKKEEFKEKVGYINIQINKFIHDYANDASKVPIYEKSDFLRFRHVPDDFGIEYILFERNKERENREKREREAEMADEEYTPSATAGDYSPSCPWNAPGMSMSDFI